MCLPWYLADKWFQSELFQQLHVIIIHREFVAIPYAAARRTTVCITMAGAVRYSEGSLIRRFVIPNTQISYTWRFVNPKMK